MCFLVPLSVLKYILLLSFLGTMQLLALLPRAKEGQEEDIFQDRQGQNTSDEHGKLPLRLRICGLGAQGGRSDNMAGKLCTLVT